MFVRTHEPGTKNPSPSANACNCFNAVAVNWQEKVKSLKPTSMVAAVQLLIESRQFDGICYRHLHALGGKLGLQINKLDTSMLKARLNDVYDRCGNLWDLKTNATTYQWFRKANRPPQASDTLGLYCFFHQSPPLFQPNFFQSPSAPVNSLQSQNTTQHHLSHLKDDEPNIPQL